MIVIKVILVVIGVIALASSYFLESEDKSEISPESVEGLNRVLEEQADYASGRLKDSVTETLDKAEDDLSRLSVKKMNEFNEFSEQILTKVEVNHKEVMFVYDMLSEKQKEVNETIGRLEDVKHEVNELIIMLNKAAEGVSKETLEAENMISITQNIEKIRDQIVGEISKNKVETTKETAKATKTSKTTKATKAKTTTKTTAKDVTEEKADVTTDKAGDKETTKSTKTNATTKSATKTTKSTTKAKTTTKSDKSEVKTQAKSLSTKKNDTKIDDESQSKERYKNIQGEVLEYQNANEQILQLHDEGLSYIEISKKLDLGVGEVMLVINLYKNKISK